MRPLLFEWRGIKIWSYPALLYVGLIAGVTAGNVIAHESDINRFRVYVATLLLIPFALIGARLLYVVSHWQLFRGNLTKIWDRNEGGWSFYGGPPLTLLLSIPLLRAFRLGFGEFWDIATITILVGMLFARLGCLLNGCCSGRATDSRFGLWLPNHQGVWCKRVPSQLLEIIWASGVLIAALALRHRMPFPGALLIFALGAYGSGRFAMEFARERDIGEGTFTVEHGISLLTALVSISILATYWRK